MVKVEVVYAKPDDQTLISISVPANSSIQEVIQLSGILLLHPEIDLSKNKVGIFSEQRDLNEMVQEGDRVEIYRALLIDPKQKRREQAKLKTIQRKKRH